MIELCYRFLLQNLKPERYLVSCRQSMRPYSIFYLNHLHISNYGPLTQKILYSNQCQLDISLCVSITKRLVRFSILFFFNLLFSFWNSLFGTKWNRMANLKHASNFMQWKQQTGIYVYLRYTPFQETKCLLFKI